MQAGFFSVSDWYLVELAKQKKKKEEEKALPERCGDGNKSKQYFLGFFLGRIDIGFAWRG